MKKAGRTSQKYSTRKAYVQHSIPSLLYSATVQFTSNLRFQICCSFVI